MKIEILIIKIKDFGKLFSTLSRKNSPSDLSSGAGFGFIGSNIVEELVRLGHRVRVLDNFSTGRRENLERFLKKINESEAEKPNLDDEFNKLKEDILDLKMICMKITGIMLKKELRK